MKKNVLKLSAVFAAMLCCSATYAQDFALSGFNYRVLDESTCVLVAPVDKDAVKGKVEIESEVPYDGKMYSVVTIEKNAFKDCNGLTQVVVPNSVTILESGAFQDCRNLASVSLSNGLNNIGTLAFSGCNALGSIDIPETVGFISKQAFYGCTSLTSVVLPNSVTYLGDAAFWDCTKLANVTLSEGLRVIPAQAFLGCSSLTAITLPESVTGISTEAFQGTALKTVNCLAVNPPVAVEEANNQSSFSDDAYENADVYVPAGSLDSYKTANGWRNFKKLHANGTSGINNIATDAANGEQTVYDLQGRKLDQPERGQVNIINGKKVFVAK